MRYYTLIESTESPVVKYIRTAYLVKASGSDYITIEDLVGNNRVTFQLKLVDGAVTTIKPVYYDDPKIDTAIKAHADKLLTDLAKV